MADKQFIELLSINYGSRTFVYKFRHKVSTVHFQHLPGLFESTSILSWKRIGAPNTLTTLASQPKGQMNWYRLSIFFQCIDRAGLKLSMDNSSFGQEKIEFLCKTNSIQGIALSENNYVFQPKIKKTPMSVKPRHWYIGFAFFYGQYLPNSAEKSIPL